MTFANAKGFAYCRFFDKSSAALAIIELNNATFQGKKIKASLSMDTRVIQIMDLPTNWPDNFVIALLKVRFKFLAPSVLIG